MVCRLVVRQACVRSNLESSYSNAVAFLTEQGRMKFTRTYASWR